MKQLRRLYAGCGERRLVEIGLRKVLVRSAREEIAESRSKVEHRDIGMEEKNAPNQLMERTLDRWLPSLPLRSPAVKRRSSAR